MPKPRTKKTGDTPADTSLDLRARILGARRSTVEPKPVDLPHLGRVYALPLAASEGDEIDALGKDKPAEYQSALLVARSIVDERRERVFSDDDAPQLLELPMVVWNPLLSAAASVNGLTSEAAEARKNA